MDLGFEIDISLHATTLTSSQLHSLKTTSRVLGSISITSSLLVILIHIFFRRPKRRFNDPVLWLSVCTFFIPIFALGTEADSYIPWWCHLEAVGNQFFSFASFVWVSFIGHQLYMIVVYEQDLGELSSTYSVSYHLIAWGLSLLTVCVLGLAKQLQTQPGPYDLWCWVLPGKWRLFLFYIPLLLFVVLNLAVYIAITVNVYRKSRNAMEASSMNYPSVHASSLFNRQAANSLSSASQTLSWAFRASLYLIAFVLTKSGSLINRSWELAHPDQKSFALLMLHVCTQGVQGLFYGLIYMYNESVVRRLKSRFGDDDVTRDAIMMRTHEHPYMDMDSEMSDSDLELDSESENHSVMPVQSYFPSPLPDR